MPTTKRCRCILSETIVVQPDIVYVESARGSLVSAHSIDAYAAAQGVFGAVARLTGEDRGPLPPFSSLPIPAATLWS